MHEVRLPGSIEPALRSDLDREDGFPPLTGIVHPGAIAALLLIPANAQSSGGVGIRTGKGSEPQWSAIRNIAKDPELDRSDADFGHSVRGFLSPVSTLTSLDTESV